MMCAMLWKIPTVQLSNWKTRPKRTAGGAGYAFNNEHKTNCLAEKCTLALGSSQIKKCNLSSLKK